MTNEYDNSITIGQPLPKYSRGGIVGCARDEYERAEPSASAIPSSRGSLSISKVSHLAEDESLDELRIVQSIYKIQQIVFIARSMLIHLTAPCFLC